jgi:hypothetical protein
VQGRVEPIGALNYSYAMKLINKTSKTRSSRGEYTYSLSSSGVIENITLQGAARTIN